MSNISSNNAACRVDSPFSRQQLLCDILVSKQTLEEADAKEVLTLMLQFPDIGVRHFPRICGLRASATLITEDVDLVKSFLKYYVSIGFFSTSIELTIILHGAKIFCCNDKQIHVCCNQKEFPNIFIDIENFLTDNDIITSLFVTIQRSDQSCGAINFLQKLCGGTSSLRNFSIHLEESYNRVNQETLLESIDEYMDLSRCGSKLITNLLKFTGIRVLLFFGFYFLNWSDKEELHEAVRCNTTLSMFIMQNLQASTEAYIRHHTLLNAYGKGKVRLGDAREITDVLANVNKAPYHMDRASLLYNLLHEGVNNWSDIVTKKHPIFFNDVATPNKKKRTEED